MGRRQSTSRNCVELEQMLKQTLFCCFLSFCNIIILPLSLSFLFSVLTVVYGIQPYLAHLALDRACSCPWMCCSYNSTVNCIELLFHLLVHSIISHGEFCRCNLLFCNYLGLLSYLVSYYCNKLQENWKDLHFQALYIRSQNCYSAFSQPSSIHLGFLNITSY